MEYYNIDFSTKRKEVGKVVQVIDGIIPPTVLDLFDESYITYYHSIRAPEDIGVPVALLEKKAKMTHLLSTSFVGFSGGLLVSRKLKEILEENSYGIQFIPTKAISRSLNIEADYFIAHYFEYADAWL